MLCSPWFWVVGGVHSLIHQCSYVDLDVLNMKCLIFDYVALFIRDCLGLYLFWPNDTMIGICVGKCVLSLLTISFDHKVILVAFLEFMLKFDHVGFVLCSGNFAVKVALISYKDLCAGGSVPHGCV